MMANRERIAQRLTGRLAELEARVGRIEDEQRQPLDADSSERVVEREDDEVLDGVELSALLEIEQIKQALARLSSGRYGACVSCGDPIEPARMEAMPAAALCMNCAVREGGRSTS